MNRKRRFFLNSLLMSFCSVLVSGIGVWFSLSVSAAIGAEAMGVFQLILSVVGFGATFACSGVQLASARLVAQKLGESQPGSIRGVMRRSFGYGGAFGTAGCALLFFLSEPIAQICLRQPVTALPLRIAAFSLPFTGLGAALNGYFTAVSRVGRCCAIQVLQQLLRVGLTLLSLRLWGWDLSRICCCILGASLLSQAVGFLLLLLLYERDSARFGCGSARRGDTRALLSIALPIGVSTYLRSGLLTVKNLLVPVGLTAYGLSRAEAVSAFGELHGVVLPCVLFFGVLLSAASDLLMPELAKAMGARKNPAASRQVVGMVEKMFQISLLYSLFVAAGLFSLSAPLSVLMGEGERFAFYLKLFAPLVPVMYFDTAVDSMLKGLGQQLYSMGYNILDAAISLFLVLFLLPRTGLPGYLFILFNSEVLNAALSLNRLLRVTQVRFPIWKLFGKPLLASVASGALVLALCRVLGESWPFWAVLLAGCGALIFTHGIFWRLFDCLGRRERIWLREVLRG